MLNTLQWEINTVTPVSFLVPLLSLVSSQDVIVMAMLFVQHAVTNVSVLEQFPASVIASAALYAARRIVLLQGWTEDLQTISGYEEDELVHCSSVFVALHNENNKSRLNNATMFAFGS